VVLVDGEPRAASKASIVIGRSTKADLVIPSPKLSRMGVAIRFCADGAAIEDLGSSCGVWVNGERVTGPTLLCEHDEIFIADSILRVVATGVTPAESARPAPAGVPDGWRLGLELEDRRGRTVARKVLDVVTHQRVSVGSSGAAALQIQPSDLDLELEVDPSGQPNVRAARPISTTAGRSFDRGVLALDEGVTIGDLVLFTTVAPQR
jgi:hypothetical protein